MAKQTKCTCPSSNAMREDESEAASHTEDDGCPKELAVLQRCWRENQRIAAPAFKDKTQINKRVQARYDFLMERGQHGHYETMFKCVHEELELQRQALAQADVEPQSTNIVLNAEEWQAFLELCERPARSHPKLADLFAREALVEPTGEGK